MEKLKTTRVSTLTGTLAILVSALPLVTYMQYFKNEAAKESVHATPTWMNHIVVKK
jgi:hypothetical protein